MTPPRTRPAADDAWDEDAGRIPLVPGPVAAADPSKAAVTGVEAVYGSGPLRAALASTIHDAGCYHCGDGHGSGPSMAEDQAATIADAVLAAGYRRVVGDDTTVWTVARTLAGVDGLEISRPGLGEDPTSTARQYLALAHAAVESLREGVPVNDVQDNLANLIRRVEVLDNDVAGLSDDVVATIGDTEESVRICGEVRVALQQLAALLEDARHEEQP